MSGCLAVSSLMAVCTIQREIVTSTVTQLMTKHIHSVCTHYTAKFSVALPQHASRDDLADVISLYAAAPCSK